jgi:hypothetical protein
MVILKKLTIKLKIKGQKMRLLSEKAPMYPEEKLTQLKKGLGF